MRKVATDIHGFTYDVRRLHQLFRRVQLLEPYETRFIHGVAIYHDGDKGYLVSEHPYHVSAIDAAKQIEYTLQQKYPL